jgi:transcriptional regulator with XRE-family HTH domain
MKPNIAESLKILRRRKGLTQEDLARLLGVSRITIARWETGQRFPTTEQLIKLSEILGVSPEELLKIDETALSLKDFAEWLIKEVYKEEGLVAPDKEALEKLSPLVVKKLEALKEELRWFISLEIIERLNSEDF